MKEVSVSIKDLYVEIDSKPVLKGVNLEVPKRCVYAVMGPSGSGKSTLLRCINRLIDIIPNARVKGSVYVEGLNIYEGPIDPSEVRRIAGMVFQIPNPLPNLSIYENVALGPRLNGMVKGKKELDALVEWALRKAALWDEVNDRLKDPALKLSGGQQQRLCLARALSLRPKILLMDEPTSNLDPVGAAKIEGLMNELKNEFTVILVTHNSFQASRVSDFVAFMYDGKILENGPTNEVFTRPKHELTEKFVTGRI